MHRCTTTPHHVYDEVDARHLRPLEVILHFLGCLPGKALEVFSPFASVLPKRNQCHELRLTESVLYSGSEINQQRNYMQYIQQHLLY